MSPSAATVSDKITWTCHVCGLESRTWAAAERHARAEQHCRIEINLAPRRAG